MSNCSKFVEAKEGVTGTSKPQPVGQSVGDSLGLPWASEAEGNLAGPSPSPATSDPTSRQIV